MGQILSLLLTACGTDTQYLTIIILCESRLNHQQAHESNQIIEGYEPIIIVLFLLFLLFLLFFLLLVYCYNLQQNLQLR